MQSKIALSLLGLAGVLFVGCKGGHEAISNLLPDTPKSETAKPSAPPPPASPTAATPPAGGAGLAFPGAEGFGATARGGRGGKVCKVTSLAKAGAGSLAACIDKSEPRIVVFDVSGVIEGPIEIKHGHLTIAGQTSPRGIILKGGLVCDNVYDPNDCNDVVVRHLRFRHGEPDSLRLGGARDVIVDHCSFAQADDENLEITRSSNITVQHSVIAEPLGEHFKWGGVLINYSKDKFPLDAITLHHNVWNGVAGRLPEISCEENGDGPGKSNCKGHVTRIEITNNVMWDASDPIWFNRCTGTNQGNDCAPSKDDFSLALNLVGNVYVRRSGGDREAPMIEANVWKGAVFADKNGLFIGAAKSDVQKGNRPARHPFPAVTTHEPDALVKALAKSAGAFPRDAMDARLASYLNASVDQRPRANNGNAGLEQKDALAAIAAGPVNPDTDGDGMPDAWKRRTGRTRAQPMKRSREFARAAMARWSVTSTSLLMR